MGFLLAVFFLGTAIPFFALAQEDLEKIIFRVSDKEEIVGPEIFGSWFNFSPVLKPGAASKAEIENVSFCPEANEFFCDFLRTKREKIFIEKINNFSIEKDKIGAYLEDLGRRVNKDPVDAKFKVEDGRVSVFSLAKNGIKLDTEKSLEIIFDNLENLREAGKETEINLAFQKIEPEIKSDSIDNMGITTLIGEGKSNFAGSPKNRIFNIKVTINRFNGVLIKPGEEFSFVKVLGEVDGEHGYLPELVIKRDKTEPEFGGGICQVSTTTFRAAIYSGLKITARRNHAYPVRYYNPQGMDATVYVPRPDLRFINNTPGYILIQTKIEGTQLIFDFYGTSDGRTIEIEGPKIFDRQPDGAMKATFTQIVKDKDGNEIIRDVFNSNYDSPFKYPHPGEEVLKEKPENWSKSEWKDYKKAHGM